MASSSSTSLLLSLLLFSLLSVSSAQILTRAAEILADSGYNSMSSALDVASRSSTAQPPSLTVFAPADAAFPYSGQPSPSLVRYHLLPHAFHLRALKALPYGAKIPTLLPAGYDLTVTTLPADGVVSLNKVAVTASPIYDDGDLIIYGTNTFFDAYFRISGPIPSYGRKNRGCVAPRNPNGAAAAAEAESAANYPFSEASKVLVSEGCSVMASFLEMQFLPFVKSMTELTVFAPVDHAMANQIGDPSQYSSLFNRHLSPCKVSWNDLVRLDDGALLSTNLQGFMINVSRNDGVLVLNGASVVVMPEMYRSHWLVVHGISEVLAFLPESPPEQVVAPPPDLASPPESEAVENTSGEDDVSPDESPRTEPADEAIEGLSPLEFNGGDLEEFEAGNSTEMFANMTEDEEAISHRRFFVYRPQ